MEKASLCDDSQPFEQTLISKKKKTSRFSSIYVWENFWATVYVFILPRNESCTQNTNLYLCRYINTLMKNTNDPEISTRNENCDLETFCRNLLKIGSFALCFVLTRKTKTNSFALTVCNSWGSSKNKQPCTIQICNSMRKS